MKHIITIITIITLFTLGCKKDTSVFEVRGTVVNKQLQEKLANVNVYLDAKVIEGGVYNNNFTNIASTTTNSTGAFEFDVEESTVSEYRFRLDNDGYFDIEETTSIDVVHQEDGYSPRFEMVQESFIELNVRNTMPQGTDDEIKYRFIGVEVEGKECCDNESTTGTGFDYEASHTCSVQSHAWIQLQWTVTKSGTPILNYDSLYTGDGETVTFDINY